MLGLAGDPDRQVFAHDARTCLVELKRPGAGARTLQRKRHQAFRGRGFEVFVLDTIEAVEWWAATWLRLHTNECPRDSACVKPPQHRGACRRGPRS